MSMKHFAFCFCLVIFFVRVGKCQELLPRMDANNKKYGFVDENGKWAIKAEYDYAKRFVGEYAVVALDKDGENGKERMFGFVDRKGNRIICPKFYKVGGYSEGCFRVQQDKGGNWSFLNKKGRKAFNGSFYYAGSFNDGVAVVAVKDKQQNCKFGYINKKGEMIVKPLFDYVYDFKDGYGKVVFGKDLDTAKFGYVDRKGKTIVECKFDDEGASYELEKVLSSYQNTK
jgi:hypothetical protein